MSHILQKLLVLKLNSAWQRLDVITVRKAIEDMTSNRHGHPPALGMDVQLDASGNFADVVPTRWEDWINLPVRECDLGIATGRGLIRAPTVTICANYKKMNFHHLKPNKRGVFERDGGVDQYTGERLSYEEASLDHVIPRDRGGKHTWDNLVVTSREVNSRKGNRLNAEVGYRLQRPPFEPKPLPMSAVIRDPRHPSWVPFMRDILKV